MRKVLLIIIFFIITYYNLNAQYDWHLQQEKYWYYRSRLDYFVFPGTREGESQIADCRNHYNGIDISWGQQGVYLGYYMGVLATEYYLINYYGFDASKTRHELELVLNAYINQLDMCEQKFYNKPDAYDGFFVRNNVPCNFLENNNPSNPAGVEHYAAFNKNLTDYQPPNDGKPGWVKWPEHDVDPNICEDHPLATFSPTPFGQDEAIGILKGLALVWRCLPSGDQLRSQAKEIAIKIIDYMAFCQWEILEPDLSFVGTNNGGSAIGFSWAFSMVAAYFGVNPFLYWGAPLWINGPYYSLGGFGGFQGTPRSIWQVTQYGGNNSSSQSMSVNLAAICACYTNEIHMTPGIFYPAFTNTTPAGININSNQYYWNGFYNMLYEFLHNNRTLYFSNSVRSMVKDQIANAPFCGPYCFTYGNNMAPFGWASSYKFEVDNDRQTNGKDQFEGVYNGLDYMLLYNLFHIIEIWDYHDGVRDAVSMPLYYNQKYLEPWHDYLPYCYNNSTAIGTIAHPAKYTAFNTIESTQKIDVILHNGNRPDGTPLPCDNAGDHEPGSAIYEAVYAIILKPGFQVSSGASFTACIKPFDCAGDFNKSMINQDNWADDDWSDYYMNNDIATYTGFEVNRFDSESQNNDTLINNINDLEFLAYPNPFITSTTIQFTIQGETDIKLSVIDLLDNIVEVIYSGKISKGLQKFTLGAKDLKSGVYICKIEGQNIDYRIKLIKL